MKHTVEHYSNIIIETVVVGNTINQENPFCIHGHVNVKIYYTYMSYYIDMTVNIFMISALCDIV